MLINVLLLAWHSIANSSCQPGIAVACKQRNRHVPLQEVSQRLAQCHLVVQMV